jgi:PAS domain-containing protein
VFVELSSSLIYYNDKPASLISFRDITNRKMMEVELIKHRNHLEQMVAERTENLEKSEKRYRDLVENALIGIYQTTLAGDRLHENENMRRMLGYNTVEELLSVKVQKGYKNPEDRQKMIALLNQTGKVQDNVP